MLSIGVPFGFRFQGSLRFDGASFQGLGFPV